MSAATAVAGWPSIRESPLPFATAPQDRERWRRTVLRCDGPALLFAAALPWLPKVVVERLAAPPPSVVALLKVAPEAERPRPPPAWACWR